MTGWTRHCGPHNPQPTKPATSARFMIAYAPVAHASGLSGQGFGNAIIQTNAWWAGRNLVNESENYLASTSVGRKNRTMGGWARTAGASNPVYKGDYIPAPTPYPTNPVDPAIASAPVTRATPWTNPSPGRWPRVPDWVDPFSKPIGEPLFTPAPPRYREIPLRRPHPWRSPWERTDKGPAPRPSPRPEPATRPGPGTSPGVSPAPSPGPTFVPGNPVDPRNPYPDPLPIPDTIVITQPIGATAPGTGTTVVTHPNANPHQRSRPEPGTKEHKIRGKKSFQIILGVAGFVTESLDALNAVWKALPEECRTGYYKLRYRDKATGEFKTYMKRRFRANQSQRLGDVTKCWKDVDMEKALENLLMNQLEDAGIGAIGRLNRDAITSNPYHTSPVGFQAGPWDTISVDMLKQLKADERLRLQEKRRAERLIQEAQGEFRRRLRADQAALKARRNAERRSARAGVIAARTAARHNASAEWWVVKTYMRKLAWQRRQRERAAKRRKT